MQRLRLLQRHSFDLQLDAVCYRIWCCSSCGLDSIPGPRTSVCCGRSHNLKKKKDDYHTKEKFEKKKRRLVALVPSSEKPLSHKSKAEEEANVQAESQKEEDEAEVPCTPMEATGAERGQARWRNLLNYMSSV